MKNKNELIQKINVKNIFQVFSGYNYPVFKFIFVEYFENYSDAVSPFLIS
ncbi:hypothetical protein [Mycoplasmopsis gallopavonis]|nr:hypothetical protein [Mycoplasmopsis gallopavonis]